MVPTPTKTTTEEASIPVVLPSEVTSLLVGANPSKPSSSSTSIQAGGKDSDNANNNIVWWSPTGSWWRDFWYFCGPGWFVSIAYIDPGNYQADIQAGATTRYTLVFTVWWTTILSIYVQILCVRLAYHSKMNLAEARAFHLGRGCTTSTLSKAMRYMNWAIAEFSIVLTDLPEVIGIGIACNIFFGWPYWVGVLLSLGTTMVFLATMNHYGNIYVLECIIFLFVALMAMALFAEVSLVGINTHELIEGWFVGFKDVQREDLFSITGILGCVVMPHNLYLHTASIQQSRHIHPDHSNNPDTVQLAIQMSSIESAIPIVLSFFINVAIVTIAAETMHGQETTIYDNNNDNSNDSEDIIYGMTSFCQYFENITGGCILFAIALLAAGQSAAITTTYAGQCVMNGFLDLQLPVPVRAILTRLVAITPCVIMAGIFPNQINTMVNVVNSALAFLLPFAFTPLVRYNCSEEFMGGPTNIPPLWERYLLYGVCIIVWALNAISFSSQGGGLLGETIHDMEEDSPTKVVLRCIEIGVQIFYAWWNWNCLTSPIPSMLSATTTPGILQPTKGRDIHK